MNASSRTESAGDKIGLDSFLDIVTNVIGALFFVLVFVALSSFGARGKVTLPIVSVANTEPVLFECRGNTVLFPAIERLEEDASKALMDAMNKGMRPESAVAAVNQAGIGNPYYSCTLELTRMKDQRVLPSIVLTPMPGAAGETAAQLKEEGSVFRGALSQFDPKTHHIFFIVRSDSFEVFHVTRKAAIRAGFRIGWEPLSADEPYRAATSGRSPEETF